VFFMLNLDRLSTEQRNPNTLQIDQVSTLEMVKLINDEDKQVALAVERVLPMIAEAIEVIAVQFKQGGRLVYLGAGTSGRLGILDASECPPTFGADPNLVIGLMAGGDTAIRKAVEGAEDSRELGANDLAAIGFTANDVAVGLAASGRTPYVIGGLEYAKRMGAQTIAIACTSNSVIGTIANICIEALPGPEVITGSTRMKAGTVQKLILNMLSTGSMIKIGKVYSNLMVDVQATNQKLVERAKRIVSEAAGVDRLRAEELLQLTNYDVKLAILIERTNLPLEQAQIILQETDGYLQNAIDAANSVDFNGNQDKLNR
jgi:N-acetylmuramic acid 6-phosphate etherase